MKPLTREWLDKAGIDVATYERLASAPDPQHDSICFHAQQAAEKSLKAMLQERGIPVDRTHDLVAIVHSLAPPEPRKRGPHVAATKREPAMSTAVAAIPLIERDHRPFECALGASIHDLAPRIREHVLQSLDTVVRYRGRMRVWRDGGWRGRLAGALLRIGLLARTMFPDTGEEVEFEIEHAVERHADGSVTMSWLRTFRFQNTTRRFDALMRFHPDQGPIVMWSGCLGWLHVELCPEVENGEIVVVSRREWLGRGRLRIPIPGWLKGRPHVRESQEPDGTLRIRVEIRNTLLGQFFGYEGRYKRL